MEAFWQAWHEAKRFDGSRGEVMAWLLMICRSRAHMAPKAKPHGWVMTEADCLLFLRGAVSPHALR
ncbi:MAG: hypothetical protein WCA45_16215 [Thiobacillaceae bacterium]